MKDNLLLLLLIYHLFTIFHWHRFDIKESILYIYFKKKRSSRNNNLNYNN
jgi:hypothetical protein